MIYINYVVRTKIKKINSFFKSQILRVQSVHTCQQILYFFEVLMCFYMCSYTYKKITMVVYFISFYITLYWFITRSSLIKKCTRVLCISLYQFNLNKGP